MIPLLHLTTSISALFCYFAAQRLYFSYRRSKNINIGDFLKAYIALGVYFLLVSLPAVLSDPVKVQIVYILSYIPLMLSAPFLLRVAFRISGHQPWSGYLFFLVCSLLVVTTALNVIFFSSSKMRTSDSLFYHWGEGTPGWLAIFNGLLIGILALGCALLFLLGGRKSEEKLVRARSFRIGMGLLILVTTSLLNYILPAYLHGVIRWLSSTFASFVALLGLILMLVGIYYKEKEVNKG